MRPIPGQPGLFFAGLEDAGGCEIRTKVINKGRVGFSMICDKELIGYLDLERTDTPWDEKGWNIEGVFVDPAHQRKGFATRLYEKAAAFACEHGEPLVSLYRVEDANSNAFWAKQEKKGRAQRLPNSRELRGHPAFRLTSCPSPGQPVDLSGLPPALKNPWVLAGGALLALALLRPQGASEPPLRVPASRAAIGPLLDAAAARHGIPAALLRGVAYVESRWSSTAGSGVGAVGVMQLMPEVAKNLGVTDRTDPRQNIEGGAKFLKSLYVKAGSWPVALAAYNWGPGNVFGNNTKPPRMYSAQWPAATQQYVREILDAEQRGVTA